MMRIDDREDNFFDAYDEIRSSVDSSSSNNSLFANEELLQCLEYEIWTSEPMSVHDRRQRFLRGLGINEPVPTSVGCSMYNEVSKIAASVENPDFQQITSDSGSVSSSWSCTDVGRPQDSLCCIRDLDSGRKFMVHELGRDGLPSMFREVGSDKLLSLQDFEIVLGLSQSVQKFLQREFAPSDKKTTCSIDTKLNKYVKLWRSFTRRKLFVGACKYDVSVKKTIITRSVRTKVDNCRKSCMEFTALYMGEEIQAHKGRIITIRFCPTGRYLATGGEDCVLRVWQIVQSTCRSPRLIGKAKGSNLAPEKGGKVPYVFIPKKTFKIEDTPVQELKGHTSDILDLSWAKSYCLLTSSKDKTVRMWKVGCPGCLKIFLHNDYVTCVQFNPIDDSFFISGSIDGKVRIWQIPDSRVIDWVDARDIITAIHYQPNGKQGLVGTYCPYQYTRVGFIVGSIKGNCRFYDLSANTSHFNLQLSLFSRKKSCGKRITSFQFCPGDSKIIMIASADSSIRICNEGDVILKFKAPRKAKRQLSASFTSDGRHIISIGEDSNVYIWNYNKPGKLPSGSGKSIRSSEFFFSKGATIAVPWPGMGCSTMNDSSQISAQPRRALELVSRQKNPDCCSLGSRLFPDSSSRVSATWPEEKLSWETKAQLLPGDYWSLTPRAGTWNSVIVTAGIDGAIRSFNNYGSPTL